MMRTVRALAVAATIAMSMASTTARAEIDGHGPDAWRVTGVSSNDVLNARMGPGTSYPVIETFSHDERGMLLVTCVPYYTLAHYERMTEAQIDALPARWCLVRNASLSKAGWVAQRYITPDGTEPVAPAAPEVSSGDAMIAEASSIVHALYEANARAELGQGPDPLHGPSASQYFTSDILAFFRSGGLGAHPLYGAQDFDGSILRIAPDPHEPMLRGMIIINVNFTNFGQLQRAVFYLRADTTQQGAPLRIFRVEHDGWSYP